jgi:hypothetical protein
VTEERDHGQSLGHVISYGIRSSSLEGLPAYSGQDNFGAHATVDECFVMRVSPMITRMGRGRVRGFQVKNTYGCKQLRSRCKSSHSKAYMAFE